MSNGKQQIESLRIAEGEKNKRRLPTSHTWLMQQRRRIFFSSESGRRFPESGRSARLERSLAGQLTTPPLAEFGDSTC